MPWFHHKSEEEKRQEAEQKQFREQELAEQQATLASLARGGIPIPAQRRLDEFRNRGGSFFTSDLTVNEFLLSRQVGLQPLTQVMGSSIYHVGWQYMPTSSWGGWGRSMELETISRAMNHARELALGRLLDEAERAGADAVIGVHITRGEYDWGEDLIEFNAVGTAVKVPGGRPTKHPALTNLSGQDFWKLYASGFWPSGIVGASTVYYVVAGWATQWADSGWGSWVNQELTDFTQGLNSARHISMMRIQQQSRHLGAFGVVGMEIDQEEEEYEVELSDDTERTDMIFTFHALGTAIGELETQQRIPPIYATVNLNA
jgi:uncharacterized protein YbjQ (UPF0145 family)